MNLVTEKKKEGKTLNLVFIEKLIYLLFILTLVTIIIIIIVLYYYKQKHKYK